MEMREERFISAPKPAVWAALFDPEVLRQCIPGCESVERLSDTQYKAAVTLAVGPVKAKFAGEAVMSDIDAPNGCKLTGKGSGGVAGFGKGEATITLAERDGGTLLSYVAKASVGGKIAQIGQRLIDSTARKLADDFFGRFVAVIEAGQPAGEAVAVPSPAAGPVPTGPVAGGWGRQLLLAGLAAALLIAAFYLFG